MTTAKFNAITHRWVAELTEFEFTIKYRPVKSNGDADGLSRMPLHMEKYMHACSQEIQPEVISSITRVISLQTQGQDPWMCPLSIATLVAEGSQEHIPCQ